MLLDFGRKDDGNVMIMFATMLAPMMVSVGAGIDLASAYQARSIYQASLDAAVLGAAKELARTGNQTEAKAYGNDIFRANVINLKGAYQGVQWDFGNGDCSDSGVTATATLKKKLAFGGFYNMFGANFQNGTTNWKISATVKCGSDSIEVAMVLDNSGSMRGSKLQTLQSASRSLVNSLHNSMSKSGKPDPIKFSLVPFSSMVNVGSKYQNAAWMDKNGLNPYHHEHLDWDSNKKVRKIGSKWVHDDGRTMTRFTLYNEIGIQWKGCVEQLEHPFHTRDVSPTPTDPRTLFVPSFAPDTPDNWSGEKETWIPDESSTPKPYCTKWYGGRWKAYCRKWSDGYKGYYHPTEGYANRYGGDYDKKGRYIAKANGQPEYGSTIREETYQNNYLVDWKSEQEAQYNHQYHPDHTGTGTKQYGRQKWTWKYFGGTPKNVNNNTNGLPSLVGLEGGPNAFCTAAPLTPLTGHHGTVISGISNMKAEGATNVQQGIAWGWRTLSSGAPFTEGRPESERDNKKIMIVMTDGNNTYYPIDYFYSGYSKRNPAYYSSYGFNGGRYETPLKERMFEGFDGIANPGQNFDTYRQAMDEHLLETCTNAKNAGIQIHTVAFDVDAGSSVLKKMQACASRDSANQPLYYDAKDNAALIDAFASIAEKIQELSVTN